MIEPVALAKKLQLRAGMRLWLVDVPRPFAEALTTGAEIEPVSAGDSFDGVVAFCRNPIEVASFAMRILPDLPPDGLLWFAYRKGEAAKASGLGRDFGWDSLNAAGYETVRSISFDEEWTGLRFRHSSMIKARR